VTIGIVASPIGLLGVARRQALAATTGGGEILAVAFRHDHPLDLPRADAASQYCYIWMQLFARPSIVRLRRKLRNRLRGLLMCGAAGQFVLPHVGA
jgi:hypothetical protein